MAKKIFTERDVYWGLSDDDKVKQEGQVLYSENLDLTTSSEFYTISQEPSIEQVMTDESTIIFEAWNQVFYCDNASNLYRQWNSTPVLTAEKIVATWITSLYLYLMDTSEDIHRILLSDLNEVNWTAFITQTDSSIPSESSPPFIVATEDITYIWIGKNVYRVLNSTWVVESANTFTIESNVVGLSMVESRVEIFTENWFYTIRDWVAWGTIRTKYLGIKIGLVKNIWNRNYIISGGAIYILNGYTLDQISFDTFSDILDSAKYDINSVWPWVLAFQEWLFYLGIKGKVNLATAGNEFVYWNDWILAMGQKKALSPNARNIFLTKLPSGRSISNITSVYTFSQPKNSFGKKLYFGYEDDLWAFWVASIDLWGTAWWTVWDNWILIYNTFDWGLKEQQKEMVGIKARIDFGNENSAVYLCSVENNILNWIWGTKEASKVTLADVGSDWCVHFTFEKFNFFNFTPAFILEQTWSYFRRQSLKFYSPSYEYEDNIRKG